MIPLAGIRHMAAPFERVPGDSGRFSGSARSRTADLAAGKARCGFADATKLAASS